MKSRPFTIEKNGHMGWLILNRPEQYNTMDLSFCIVAGGVESMTCVPLGGNKVTPNPTMINEWPESFMGMGMTAEVVAEKYGINREQQDIFAAVIHEKAANAIAANRFAEEIIPVEVEHAFLSGGQMSKKTELVSIDDGVRAGTSAA